MAKGDEIDVNGFGIKFGKTSPPKRYTSGSMVLAMENAGQLIEDEELRAQIKGNVVMVIIYLIVAFLFFSVLGGLKIGTLRRTNVMLSQMVGILCLHVVMYGQMILLYRGQPPVMPLMLLTVSEVILIYAFSYIFDFILNVLFPPRELLVIYGEYPFQPICNKIESRKDKFLIGGSMNVSAGWEAL